MRKAYKMAEINPLSNLSYTNKDFQSIYVELLDLAKKISYKWDPTISNESDPGVVLLKLCAIIADKNNYNIDKNVLECFPLSVSQESNARQLFEQLGYSMAWYRGATTKIALKWAGDAPQDSSVPDIYVIPFFTMVSDSANSIVYTIPEQVSLSQNGDTVEVDAIQGVAMTYIVNGESTITPSMLDSNNRLYFPYSNIAENGIFIQSADGQRGTFIDPQYFGGWKRVDNLAVEESGQSIFKFGVSQDDNSCYIEFPEDAPYIMGQGVNITYIKTDGVNGNISSRIIEKFYNDTSAYIEGTLNDTIVLSTDNVKITNASGASNGADPETIASAYRNYKKTVGTFNTLVTLRDYTNGINNSGYVSNGFVCDRTDDIQCSYKVMSFDGDFYKRVLYVEDNGGSPYLDAFDLKIYALQNVSNPSASALDYNYSFKMLKNDASVTDASIRDAISYIDDIKCIQHDFSPLLANRLCMIKNKYPIKCTIIPKYKVTSIQEESIIENVLRALYDALNSKNIEFGEEVSYDFVYNTIVSADERIKAIALDDITYHTYAVIFDGTDYREYNINSFPSNTVLGWYYNNAFYEEEAHSNIITPEKDTIYYDMGADEWYIYDGNNYTRNYANDIQCDIVAKSVLNGNTYLLYPDEQYKYKLSQSMDKVVEGIMRVTTNAVMDFTIDTSSTPHKASYTVKPNEHIYLYAPNLIDDVVYSTYVKFQYELLEDIEKGTDYQLSASESITFYWKDTDDDDAPYICQKYGEGTIINPSFRLPILQGSAIYVAESYPNGKGIISGIVGDQDANSYLKYLTDSKYNLTASKSIATRKVNKADLKSQVKCYWVLNKVSDDNKYVLFEQDETSYILQPDEYFMYMSDDGTELLILGSGTQISRTSTTSWDTPWAVDKIDITRIVEDGKDAIADLWVAIPSNGTVTTTEMQSITLNSGVTFIISDDAITGSPNISINNEGFSSDIVGYTHLSDFAQLSYIDTTSEEVIIAPISVTDSGWNAISYLSLNLSQTVPQELYTNQTVTCYDENGYVDINNDTESLYLLGTFDYAIGGGKDIDASHLNSVGNIEYLGIYSYTSTIVESADITYEDDGRIDVILPAGGEFTDINFKIPSGDYIFPIDVVDDDYTSLSFEVYRNVGGVPKSKDIYPINSDTTDISDKGLHYLKVSIEPEIDGYLDNGQFYEDSAHQLLITPSEDVLYRDIPNDDYYMYENNAYVSCDKNCYLCVTYDALDDGKRFIIEPIYKYTLPIIDYTDEGDAIYMDSGFAYAVLQKMISLDSNNLYDYTYSINEDEYIQNPLDATAFLNVNHIYNKFTICQIETALNKLYITNKIR